MSQFVMFRLSFYSFVAEIRPLKTISEINEHGECSYIFLVCLHVNKCIKLLICVIYLEISPQNPPSPQITVFLF